MFKNYFKIALRNIRRYYAYSILNISGMAIGMTCTILILLWVQDEWSYDRHFKNAANIYRVLENQNPSGGEVSVLAVTPGWLANTLKAEYPEILRSARYTNPPSFPLHKGAEIINEKVAMVDKDFLKMFSIKFVRGDINSAFDEPHNILITEEMALKYFNKEDPLNKTLTAINLVFTITGVVKSLPRNSHIHFDILFPIEFLKELGAPVNGEFLCYNYIELHKGTDSKIVDKKIRDLIKKNSRESDKELFLQNLNKIHLFSSRKYTYDISGHGDITYVRLMSLIAVFILLIACINFMNLSTAQSVRRAKEIGIRKVAGANKKKLIVQFLGESLLIVFVASLLAMIFVELLLPAFNNFTGKQLNIYYQSAGLYLALISFVLLCGFLAGSYPALYLSSLKSMDTMKGVITKNPGNTQFRRVLVVFQFSLSIMLIISTLIIRAQIRFIQNKNLGFNRDNIGYFQFPIAPWDPKLKTLKNELSLNPDILSVTRVSYNYENPLNIEGTSGGFTWTGKKAGNDVLFYIISADEDYAKTFQLELKAGRFFSSEFSTDNSAIVVNEQAAKVLDFKNPIGEIITSPDGSKLNIIGLVKDFHFKSLHTKIEPLIMKLSESNNFFIKMKPENIASTVDSIKKTYNTFKPEIPMDFHFLDADFNKMYQSEQSISKIIGYFTILAIVISCLGLIGLSSFMTELRTKEIGIRKINGAKSTEIFSFLSGEYIVLVMISIIIAYPIAWYAMNKWLQSFAYCINLSWWLFVLAGIISLFIAFLTVSWQSYRAAGKNPVDALRYE